jgi:acyl-coenzyme A thioesterase PaaI-like protein
VSAPEASTFSSWPSPVLEPVGRPLAEDDLADRRLAVAELGAALRGAVQASVLTEIDPDGLRDAAADLRAITTTLRSRARTIDSVALVDEWSGMTRMFNPVFGEGSALAPPVTFEVIRAGAVRGRCTLGPAYEGPFMHVHGGVTALLLDQAVGHIAASGGRAGVTASLTVQYRRPVPLGVPLILEGEVCKEDDPRKTWTSVRLAAAENPDVVLAEAEGLMITLLPERAEQVFDGAPNPSSQP